MALPDVMNLIFGQLPAHLQCTGGSTVTFVLCLSLIRKLGIAIMTMCFIMIYLKNNPIKKFVVHGAL